MNEISSAASADAAGAGAAAPSSSSERSLALLALVAAEGRALSLAEMSMRLGLPKASAHRICTQLQEGDWLMRDADERSFTVGPALRRLALDTLNNGIVRGLRHQVLAELVARIGETCNFTTLDGATLRASAIARTVSPASSRAIARSRISIERGLVMKAGLHAQPPW